jgi:hypothetical protein
MFKHVLTFLFFSIVVANCYQVQPQVSCPPHGRYPRYLIDSQLPGPKFYQGTHQADGQVVQFPNGSLTGGQVVANLSGLAIQQYHKDLETYMGYFFLKTEQSYQLLVNYTFTLLGQGRFCLNFLPEGVVPQYVEGQSYTDNYFVENYYSKNKKNLGEVEKSEFFAGDKNGVSTNIVSDFVDGQVVLETRYKFKKISNKPLFPQNIGHGRPDPQ